MFQEIKKKDNCYTVLPMNITLDKSKFVYVIISRQRKSQVKIVDETIKFFFVSKFTFDMGWSFILFMQIRSIKKCVFSIYSDKTNKEKENGIFHRDQEFFLFVSPFFWWIWKTLGYTSLSIIKYVLENSYSRTDSLQKSLRSLNTTMNLNRNVYGISNRIRYECTTE